MVDILFSQTPKDIVLILILLSLMIMSFFVKVDVVEINFANTVKFLLFSIFILFLTLILSMDGFSLFIIINFIYLVIFLKVKSGVNDRGDDDVSFYSRRGRLTIYDLAIFMFSAFINFVLFLIYGYAHILQNFIMTKI